MMMMMMMIKLKLIVFFLSFFLSSDSGSIHGASGNRKRSWKLSLSDDRLICKVCGLKLVPNEIEAHLQLERDRLAKRAR